MSDVMISLSNVNKEYRYYRTNHQRLMHEIFGRDAGERIPALTDVSFDIYKGDKVGLIGTTGSGRSTTLRLISRIIWPDSGEITVNGHLRTMFDHKLGMNALLTGEENIAIKGALLGWDAEKFKEYEAEVIEFTGLKDVIDKPIKTYPAGTPTVLGFAAESLVAPEILLYDESFSFGGRREFKEKCLNRLCDLVSGEDTTFIMAVNSFPAAKRLCTRGIVLDKGKMVYDGEYRAAVKYFRENCKADPAEEKAAKERAETSEERIVTNTEVDDF